MNPGTEELIKKVKSVKNEFGEDGELVKPATRYLTWQEREDREKELQQLDEFLNQPPAVMRTIKTTSTTLNNLRNRRKGVKKELNISSPPTNLTGEEKDALYKLEKELAENIREGMLPVEEMTRNSVGAVDRNLRWQREKKAAILAWKNVRRALYADSDDKDLANIEHLRPRLHTPGSGSMPMLDAEAPGHMSYSHIPDKNWESAGLPLVNPNSPLGRIEAAEATEREKQLEALVAKLEAQLNGKRERKRQAASATSERMKKRWAEKRAQKEAAHDRP